MVVFSDYAYPRLQAWQATPDCDPELEAGHMTRHDQRSRWHKIFWWSCQVLYLQLFLTLFTWPLLLAWGLPLSVVTVIGNVAFNPVVGLFLFISSLAFFCQLLGIPHGILLMGIEWLSQGWLWVLDHGSPTVLVAFPTPCLLILLALPVAGLLVIYSAWGKRTVIATAILFGLVVGGGWGLKQFVAAHDKIAVKVGNKKVWAVKWREEWVIVDADGVLRWQRSAENWTAFTLLPELARRGGVRGYSKVILLQPTVAAARAASLIAQRYPGCQLLVSEQWLMKNPEKRELLKELSLETISLSPEEEREIWQLVSD